MLAVAPAEFLALQRRMHTAIADIVRDVVYDGELGDGLEVQWRGVSLRHCFWALGPVSVVEPEGSHQLPDGQSLINEVDALAVRDVLGFLDRVQVRLLGEGSTISVMVISPYAAQVRLLRGLLEAEEFQSFAPEVLTVDASQGREANVVVISSVRTNGSGFLNNVPRANVAVTRGQTATILVGSVAPLREVPVWKQLIEGATAAGRRGPLARIDPLPEETSEQLAERVVSGQVLGPWDA